MAQYYAASYPYGVATNGNTGNLIREVYVFRTKQDRDAYVNKSPTDNRGANGYREAVRRAELTGHEKMRVDHTAPYSDADGFPIYE